MELFSLKNVIRKFGSRQILFRLPKLGAKSPLMPQIATIAPLCLLGLTLTDLDLAPK